MKRGINAVVVGLSLVSALAMAIEAYAQEVSRAITIQRDTRLGTEVLAKGEYDVRFVEGKEGEVVFLRGRREVLKATFSSAKLEKDAPYTVVVSTPNDDGTYQLKRIEFKGKGSALVFDKTVATAISKH